MSTTSIQDKLGQQIRCIRSASDSCRRPNKGPWRVSFRRALAFISDLTVIYGIGLIADHLFGKGLLAIGEDGWWIGILVIALYFAVFDSSVGRGKSPGKRIFRIEVMRVDGAQLTSFDALLRTSPFLVIFAAHHYLKSADAYSAASVVISFAATLLFISLISFGLAHPYRRSVHDLVMDSIVVRRDDAFSVRPASLKYSFIAFAVASVFAAQFTLVPGIIAALSKNGVKLSEFRTKILTSHGLKNPRVYSRFIYNDGGFARAMVVSAYMPGSQNISESSIAQDLSKKINSYMSANRLVVPGTKNIVVKIRSGYDIGIGAGVVESRRVFPYSRNAVPAAGPLGGRRKSGLRNRSR